MDLASASTPMKCEACDGKKNRHGRRYYIETAGHINDYRDGRAYGWMIAVVAGQVWRRLHKVTASPSTWLPIRPMQPSGFQSKDTRKKEARETEGQQGGGIGVEAECAVLEGAERSEALSAAVQW